MVDKNAMLKAKVKWVTVNGGKYLLLDMQNCSDEERIQLSEYIIPIILQEELNSVKILADVRNTYISLNAMRKVSRDWVNAQKHTSDIAMVGVSDRNSLLFKLWRFMTGMNIKPVKSIQEGEAYLCH